MLTDTILLTFSVSLDHIKQIMFIPKTLSFAAAVCLSALLTGGLAGCQSNGSATSETTTSSGKVAEKTEKAPSSPSAETKPADDVSGPIASAATILARPQVPILCYHQIRDWRGSDSKGSKDYIIPVATFREEMQMLADSGYHTILPDQLYAYLNKQMYVLHLHAHRRSAYSAV